MQATSSTLRLMQAIDVHCSDWLMLFILIAARDRWFRQAAETACEIHMRLPLLRLPQRFAVQHI